MTTFWRAIGLLWVVFMIPTVYFIIICCLGMIQFIWVPLESRAALGQKLVASLGWAMTYAGFAVGLITLRPPQSKYFGSTTRNQAHVFFWALVIGAFVMFGIAIHEIVGHPTCQWIAQLEGPWGIGPLSFGCGILTLAKYLADGMSLH